MDLIIAGTETNITTTATMTKHMNKSFPNYSQFDPLKTDSRQFYDRENQSFPQSYPPITH